MGIAGQWTSNRKAMEEVVSFRLLTINADGYEVFKHYHRPGDEKRMAVILNPEDLDAWLEASAEHSTAFMKPFPADLLVALAEPERGRHKKSSKKLDLFDK